MSRTVIAVAAWIVAANVYAIGGGLQAPADLSYWQGAVSTHKPGLLSDLDREVGAWPWDRARPVIEHSRLHGTSRELFLAAALYLDVAIHIPIENRPIYPSRGQAVLSRDGQPLATHRLDSQLWWARMFVETAIGRVGAGDHERQLALTWFRAVNAVLSERLNFADMGPNVTSALKYFPKAPGLLFDAGCISETLASPLFDHTRGLRGSIDWKAGGPPKPVADTQRPLLMEAERRYRAVLEIVPDDRETRVRLGRILATTKRLDESRTLLASAAQGNTGNTALDYYNWLFLGDVLADLHRFDDALAAFARAASIFPAAASPHLGISRVHAAVGRLPAARTAIQTLLAVPESDAIGADPRWHYDRCNGRNVQRVYESYVQRFRQELQ